MFINKKGKFTKQKEVERRQAAAIRTSVMNATTKENTVQTETDFVLEQDHASATASKFDCDDGDGSSARTRILKIPVKTEICVVQDEVHIERNVDQKGRFVKKKEVNRRQMAAARMAAVKARTETNVVQAEISFEHDLAPGASSDADVSSDIPRALLESEVSKTQNPREYTQITNVGPGRGEIGRAHV